jgi:hypothetical protein
VQIRSIQAIPNSQEFKVLPLDLSFVKLCDKSRKADGISDFYNFELGCIDDLDLFKLLSCQVRIAKIIDSNCNNEETMSNWKVTK